jgi:hypothetical protein
MEKMRWSKNNTKNKKKKEKKGRNSNYYKRERGALAQETIPFLCREKKNLIFWYKIQCFHV